MTQLDVNFINSTARTIRNQIFSSDLNIVFSWGYHSAKADYFQNMASLSFLVQGFDFKGRIWVSYNEGMDTYKIYGRKQGWKEPKLLNDEVYCDTLVNDLDRIIEKGEEGQKFYKSA